MISFLGIIVVKFDNISTNLKLIEAIKLRAKNQDQIFQFLVMKFIYRLLKIICKSMINQQNKVNDYSDCYYQFPKYITVDIDFRGEIYFSLVSSWNIT